MTRFTDIAPLYDGFIFDQFGVLHNGRTPYPGAVQALESVLGLGKPTVIVTNSGRSAGENQIRMENIGFDTRLFRGIVTSGDIAARRLKKTAPKDVYIIARGAPGESHAGLNVNFDPETADFLLIAGSEADTVAETDYRRILSVMAGRGIPALCSNPDFEMLTPAGLRPGAGRLAQWYEEAGGAVEYAGKPHSEIYRAAVNLLSLPPGASVCCIGDSLAHDIAGAAGAGLASALVLTGIHADADEGALRRRAAETGAAPDHILASLC